MTAETSGDETPTKVACPLSIPACFEAFKNWLPKEAPDWALTQEKKHAF